MHIFYTPDIQGDNYVLPETESKHAVRVLRVTSGQNVLLVDGKGTLYHAEVTLPDAKRCGLKVLHKETEFGKKKYHLHLAVAPTKNIDRFEWFLEKATEIGIDEITPLLCKHSERKVVKDDRLDKVIIAAMKQSVKAYQPKLHPLTDFKTFISTQKENAIGIAHCSDGDKTALKTFCTQHEKLTLLIGPEGDFSVEEIEWAMKNGAQAISLGNSRLRTETAAVVACHTVNLMCE